METVRILLAISLICVRLTTCRSAAGRLARRLPARALLPKLYAGSSRRDNRPVSCSGLLSCYTCISSRRRRGTKRCMCARRGGHGRLVAGHQVEEKSMRWFSTKKHKRETPTMERYMWTFEDYKRRQGKGIPDFWSYEPATMDGVPEDEAHPVWTAGLHWRFIDEEYKRLTDLYEGRTLSDQERLASGITMLYFALHSWVELLELLPARVQFEYRLKKVESIMGKSLDAGKVLDRPPSTRKTFFVPRNA